MELAISIIVILLCYCFFLKLVDFLITRKSSEIQKPGDKKDGPNDKAGVSPAIALVLRKSPDDPNTESGETITVIVTEGDPFHEEWEVIPDNDMDEDPQRYDTFLPPTKH
ncbi:MAG: hypothetical protein AB1424_11240 [Thermodesulfobacteriota bacterium]